MHNDIIHPLYWTPSYRRYFPARVAGMIVLLAVRYFFGAFFLYGVYHKTTRGWLWSPTMRQHFLQRLSEIDPESFSAAYLRRFAIPCYLPVAWVLTVGQLIVGVSMTLGVAVRPSAGLALFLLLNITAGAYYNASMPPFFVMALALMFTPSGHWLGLDGPLHRCFPRQPWFR